MLGKIEFRTYKLSKKSLGIRECIRCGALFLTDLRGCPKWCFNCKKVVKTEYQKRYKKLPKA
ncbi:MAG: hypothetical protein ACK4Z9_03705 [Thermodesulfovibrionales bacterium]